MVSGNEKKIYKFAQTDHKLQFYREFWARLKPIESSVTTRSLT
jgi:hypothetical protein